MRARYAIPAAGALLLVALALAGAAHQVAAWHNVIRQDDVRFVTTPAAPRLWAAPRGPGAGLTRDLLGLGDDIRFRKAERLYIRGHENATSFVQEKARLSARAADVDLLEETIAHDTSSWRRARAANLLGILLFEDSRAGQEVSEDLQPSGAPRVRDGGARGTREGTSALQPQSSCSRSCGRAAVSGAICARTSTGLPAVSGQGSLFRRSAIEHRARDSLGRARRAHSRGAGRGMGPRVATLGLGTALNRARATATWWQRRSSLGALVLAIALLGLAAAQPVVASPHQSAVRRDADVFVVLDTSRSMLASRAPETPTRFDRARSDRPSVGQGAPGRGRRDRLHDRSGPAAPLSDRESSRLRRHAQRRDRGPAATPGREHRRQRHRPGCTRRSRAGDFFPPGEHADRRRPDRRRVPRVPGQPRRGSPQASQDPPGADPARECERARVHPSGAAETYRPARGTGVELTRTALLLHASAYAEPEAKAAIAEVAHAVAAGDGVAEHSTTSVRELSLPLAVAALLPVLFLLWRRNVVMLR